MADMKKFLDQAGVSTLWSRVAAKIAEEESRAKAVEAANVAAAKKAQDEVDALELYVGTIPANYTESNIVAFVQKRAEEVLAAANGGSSETAASVAAALETYKSENNPKVQKNADDIAAIVADYLKAADKTELANSISANAGEITRIDNALKAAVENDGAGLDSIKELAAWIEEHGEDAAGYAAAIDALELLVGETSVATQIANAKAYADGLAKNYDAAGAAATAEANAKAYADSEINSKVIALTTAEIDAAIAAATTN